jgi:4-amino-4-deoxy-L-arabinose transferase-like glycosyltransferase
VVISQTAQSVMRLGWVIVILLGLLALSLGPFAGTGLWADEGFTLWVIEDIGPIPQGITQTLRFVAESLFTAFERSADDVHPPLYFVLLDAWALLTGTALFTLRLPSVFAGLLALAATHALGRRFFGHWAGVMALLLLGTSGFFLYYTQEIRMYTLLLASASLSMLGYWRWSRRPGAMRAIFYALMSLLMLYTHYAGVFILIAQILHALFTRQPMRRLALPYALIGLGYAPWLPFLWRQFVIHGQPDAFPLTTDWNTVLALLLVLGSGFPLLYLLPFVLGDGWVKLRQSHNGLLLLWLILPPVALLGLNAFWGPLFQVRYVIAILPAGALLVAGALGRVGDFRQWGRGQWRWQGILAVVLLAVLVYNQLTMYGELWGPKPRWEDAIQQAATERNPLEPAVSLIPPTSPARYYDRLYGLRQGIALDLAWRWQEPHDIALYADPLATSQSIWLMVPLEYPAAWDALRELSRGRGIGYRDSVMTTLFYRLDWGAGDWLRLRFGDSWAMNSETGQHLFANAGEDFCFPLSLEALTPDSDSDYTLDLALTQGYDTPRAALQIPLPVADSDGLIETTACLPIPADAPAGPHHLRLRLLANGQPLPLLEGPDGLYWGDVLILALVSVG